MHMARAHHADVVATWGKNDVSSQVEQIQGLEEKGEERVVNALDADARLLQDVFRLTREASHNDGCGEESPLKCDTDSTNESTS